MKGSVIRTLSVLALVAALFGAFVAFTTYQILCFGESGGSSTCTQGNAGATMLAQLCLGVAGVIPALAMVACSWRDESRQTAIAFVAGLGVWLCWAFLNDAAVHGSGSDMRLIP
jgi:uncharacterized membrane protein YhaH (DUF805 family)